LACVVDHNHVANGPLRNEKQQTIRYIIYTTVKDFATLSK